MEFLNLRSPSTRKKRKVQPFDANNYKQPFQYDSKRRRTENLDDHNKEDSKLYKKELY